MENMRVSGNKEKKKVEVDSPILMVIYMKENGLIIRHMESEHYIPMRV